MEIPDEVNKETLPQRTANRRWRFSALLVAMLLVALVASAWLFAPSALASLFPKVTTAGESFIVAPKTLIFSVEAKALLRAS